MWKMFSTSKALYSWKVWTTICITYAVLVLVHKDYRILWTNVCDSFQFKFQFLKKIGILNYNENKNFAYKFKLCQYNLLCLSTKLTDCLYKMKIKKKKLQTRTIVRRHGMSFHFSPIFNFVTEFYILHQLF